MSKPRLRIDVWSDIACPWCYIGKRHLEAALARFPERDSVEVIWRAFELDPAAPRILSLELSYGERLAKKYGTSVGRAEEMIRRMTAVAAADGLDFRFDRIRPGNTFDAHRLLHLAHERGIQDRVKERLLRAYMTEGEAIGDREALTRLAAEAGLDAEEARAVLTSSRYEREVRADEEEARALGISGVPFFVIGGRHGLSGAQPSETIREALDQAWAEMGGERSEVPEGAVCGPDGCA
jgi:predicted DsbA family dithiol-disulfide isomerase